MIWIVTIAFAALCLLALTGKIRAVRKVRPAAAVPSHPHEWETATDLFGEPVTRFCVFPGCVVVEYLDPLLREPTPARDVESDWGSPRPWRQWHREVCPVCCDVIDTWKHGASPPHHRCVDRWQQHTLDDTRVGQRGLIGDLADLERANNLVKIVAAHDRPAPYSEPADTEPGCDNCQYETLSTFGQADPVRRIVAVPCPLHIGLAHPSAVRHVNLLGDPVPPPRPRLPNPGRLDNW